MATGYGSVTKSGKMLGSVMLVLLLSTMILKQAEMVSARCDNLEVTLASCQAAVEGDNPPPPTPECCATLKTLSVGCLCKALSKDVLNNINKQAAFMLPSECDVAIPPGFNCEDHKELPVFPGDI